MKGSLTSQELAKRAGLVGQQVSGTQGYGTGITSTPLHPAFFGMSSGTHTQVLKHFID